MLLVLDIINSLIKAINHFLVGSYLFIIAGLKRILTLTFKKIFLAIINILAYANKSCPNPKLVIMLRVLLYV